MSEVPVEVNNYSLVDVFTGKTVRTFTSPRKTGPIGQMKSTYRLDFSTFDTPGTYYLKAGKAVSPHFPINHRVYNGTARLPAELHAPATMRLQPLPERQLPCT